MSSSQPFLSSASLSPQANRRRKKSRFTFKQLSQLGASSVTCPLRVVAHLDLDAFYAQCEMVRLGVPEDQPLAVQQWQGLIAINYPARKYDLSRHVTITEAKSKCPELILQHVATWKEGDEKWAYHEDAFQNIATHKVSLDPYRLQSRRILAVIKEALPPAPIQKVEKASVDEVFMDLSAQVHALLLERFPELQGPPPYDDPTERLPAPPTSALDWNVDALVDLDADQSEDDDPDWDDIAILLGSEIVRSVRAKIRSELHYTCSAGLARNKMLAKLGSGYKKPNQQTIIRNRAVQHFLSGFKFTKIRMLGGKLGDEVVSMFNTDLVKELLEIPLEQLKKLGDDTGIWLHQIIRGEDQSEVNPRTQIKSMLSAKSFRPSINNLEQAIRWLRIFAADIYSRLVEEGVTENKRRPKVINLHHRQGGQMRSKQTAIPSGRSIDEPTLLNLAKNLLGQIIVDGRAWPCSNLSLSVGGFEDGITGNRGIGSFLVRGEEARAMQQQPQQSTESDYNTDDEPLRLSKKRRTEEAGINRFFARKKSGDEATRSASTTQTDDRIGGFDMCPSGQGDPAEPVVRESPCDPFPPIDLQEEQSLTPSSSPGEAAQGLGENDCGSPVPLQQSTPDTFFCSRCQKSLLADQAEEHNDWHFAKDLQDQEQASTVPQHSSATPAKPSNVQKPKRDRGRPPAMLTAGRESGNKHGSAAPVPEKGQKRLPFFK